jgi:hypothetical protein
MEQAFARLDRHLPVRGVKIVDDGHTRDNGARRPPGVPTTPDSVQ